MNKKGIQKFLFFSFFFPNNSVLDLYMTWLIQLQADYNHITHILHGAGLFLKQCHTYGFIWSSWSIQSLERQVLKLLLWLWFHRFLSSKTFISSHKIALLKKKREKDQTQDLIIYYSKSFSHTQVVRLTYFEFNLGK